MDISKLDFDSIAPYSDEEAVKAFAELSKHPLLPEISKYMFPDAPDTFLRDTLLSIKSIDEFQIHIMSNAVEWVISNSMRSFTYDGIENLKSMDRRFLAMSNHRDIILDPALTQLVFFRNDIQRTEIAVGDNLLFNKEIEMLIRSNRMIRVIRGISSRELYLRSMSLSAYIRNSIVSDRCSVWIAQRQGRTKDGADTTEQGLLKMLEMSGTGDFVENFKELNIVPLSVSYEYEPCDILKARETLMSRSAPYVKGPREDLLSIMWGLKQQKGDVHLNIGRPLTDDEIEEASKFGGNDRYQSIRHAVDRRIIEGYRLSKTNYMGYDLANRTDKYADRYTSSDLKDFKEYTEGQLAKADKELDRESLRDIFLRIYGNPVQSVEALHGTAQD